MKYTLPTLALASFALLSSCGEKELHGPDDGHDHGDHGSHALHDHGLHKSEKGGHDDHSGHDHAKGEHDDDHSTCDHGPDGHDDHSGHDHVKAGPNQGRLIETVSPKAEFVVLDGGKVQITFFDDAMKVVAPASQIVSVVSGERSNPAELTFTAQGQSLVSTEAIPAGNNFPTIVAIKADAAGDEMISKFTLNLTDCSSCDNKEYACECHH